VRHLLTGALLAALAACSCGTTDTGKATQPSGVKLAVPPLADGEVCRYSVAAAGGAIGTRTMTIRRSEFDGTPVLALATADRLKQGGVTRLDSSLALVTPDSLTPVTSFHYSWVGSAFITASARYGVGSVGVATYSAQTGEIQRPLPFGPGTYDVGQIIVLGRAIRVPVHKTQEIAVVVPLSMPPGGNVVRGTITALPDEDIETEAGTFDCYKLLVNFGVATANVWYEKAGAHRMVKYLTPDSALSIILLPTAAR